MAHLARRLLLACALVSARTAASSTFDAPPRAFCDVVSDFGAVGDNHTEDTAAVASALKACSTVLIPGGHTFLLRPVEIPSHRHLVIDGTVAAWRDIWSWPNSSHKLCTTSPYRTPTPKIETAPQLEALLWGEGVSNVTVSGNGTIDGQGWRWWSLPANKSDGEYWHHCRPYLLAFGRGDVRQPGAISDVAVSGITLKDPPFWTVTGRGLRRARFSRVKVDTASGCGFSEAPNTDGFNLQGEDILVEDSSVRNGDDCVPLFPPTRNVLVRNLSCECGNPPAPAVWPYHSQPGTDDGDIVDVTFDRVSLRNTSSGLAMKSLPGLVGRAHNISYTNFELRDVGLGMAINFFRQGRRRAEERSRHTPLDSLDPALGAWASSVLIENVTGTVTMGAGHINCLGLQPCTDLRLVGVQLSMAGSGAPAAPYTCENATGTYADCSPAPCGWSTSRGAM
jgi:galacturan 1,4-alpha-galacturonidase